MSYNPVRAASFYKTRKGNRQPLNPHAGVKHSDIVRRQGVGTTVPMIDRIATGTGFAATLMETERFVVRSEVIGSGNHLGLGVHPTKDRLLVVRVGSMFVEVRDDVEAKYHRLQTGAHFKLPKGTVHRIAASGTEDCELLFVEDLDYRSGFQYMEAPEMRGIGGSPAAMTPDAATEELGGRRLDQTMAKTQAAAQAAAVRRRRPGRPPASAPATPAGGRRSVSGEVAIGRNASDNPNSGNVTGVSPMPMGAGAYREE